MVSRWKLAATAVATLCIAHPALAQETARKIPLPPEINYPEGVAISPVDGHVYVNSATTGTMVRVNPQDGTARLVGTLVDPAHAALTGVKALGLKVDHHGRAWVAGGATGSAYVVQVDSGEVLAQFSTPAGNTLINDVAVGDTAAYFTDTRRPVLWRALADNPRSGALEPWLDLSSSVIPYGEGANLNGIAVTADGRFLVVTHMQRGELYRIDIATREITRIEVEGGAIDGGDGLILAGQRLYIVRQPHQEIVALNLSADLTTARVHKRVTSPVLEWPATAALGQNALIIGNSQLNKRTTDTPVRPFSIAVVPLSLFD